MDLQIPRTFPRVPRIRLLARHGASVRPGLFTPAPGLDHWLGPGAVLAYALTRVRLTEDPIIGQKAGRSRQK